MTRPRHARRAALLATALGALALALAGCSSSGASATTADGLPIVKVAGSTTNPLEQASIEFVRDHVAKDYGIAIDYVHIEDTRAILEATEDKEVDANVAMHKPYMEAQNKALGYHLAAVAPLFKQRQVLYSKKYTTLDAVPDGAKVAVSNNPVAESTALVFLQEVGLVTLKQGVPLPDITTRDITSNPKHLQFVDVESVPRAFDDTDLATATAFAFYTAGISSTHEIAHYEGFSDYAEQLVVNRDDVSSPKIKALVKAFSDPRLGEYVQKNYGQLVTPLGQ